MKKSSRLEPRPKERDSSLNVVNNCFHGLLLKDFAAESLKLFSLKVVEYYF